MKTASFLFSVALLLPGFGLVRAGSPVKITVDGDARFSYSRTGSSEADLEALGLSWRKAFADSKGDRLLLSGLLEVRNNFKHAMLHEKYAQWKGPLGAWNVNAGRFSLPWGLLRSFGTTRLPFEGVYDHVVGFDADNGAMLSGIVGSLDYGLAITQGIGAHGDFEFPGPGLGSARMGWTPGTGEEHNVGLSTIYGRSYAHHGKHSHPSLKMLGTVDGTFYAGRAIVRLETTGGKSGEHYLGGFFGMMDYAWFPRIRAILTGTHVRHGEARHHQYYAGMAYHPKYITLRGGYIYENDGEADHKVHLQLYRLFAFAL